MQVKSFEAIARALNSAAVPFIVVGGLAVNAHGYGRVTVNVDLVVQLRPDTILAAFGALASLGYRPRVPITATQFADAAQRSDWITKKQMKREAGRPQDLADLSELLTFRREDSV